MNTHGQMLRRLLVMFTLILSLSAAMPIAGAAKPADNGGTGNSGAAKQCQKGGWASLARVGDEHVAFLNQNECVSYGAQGGVMVSHVLPPTVSIGFRHYTTDVFGDEICWVDVNVTNLDPEESYTAMNYLGGNRIDNTEVPIPLESEGYGYTPTHTYEGRVFDVYLFDSSGTQIASASEVSACEAPVT